VTGVFLFVGRAGPLSGWPRGVGPHPLCRPFPHMSFRFPAPLRFVVLFQIFSHVCVPSLLFIIISADGPNLPGGWNLRVSRYRTTDSLDTGQRKVSSGSSFTSRQCALHRRPPRSTEFYSSYSPSFVFSDSSSLRRNLSRGRSGFFPQCPVPSVPGELLCVDPGFSARLI